MMAVLQSAQRATDNKGHSTLADGGPLRWHYWWTSLWPWPAPIGIMGLKRAPHHPMPWGFHCGDRFILDAGVTISPMNIRWEMLMYGRLGEAYDRGRTPFADGEMVN